MLTVYAQAHITTQAGTLWHAYGARAAVHAHMVHFQKLALDDRLDLAEFLRSRWGIHVF